MDALTLAVAAGSRDGPVQSTGTASRINALTAVPHDAGTSSKRPANPGNSRSINVRDNRLVGRRRASYDPLMTGAIAFDTHRFVKRLTDCGFTEQQAETLADEHVALLNSNLATKTDIEALRQETKTAIEALRQETKTAIAAVKTDIEALRLATKADIEAVKSELLKWIVGLLIAQGGLIVALVKLL